MEEEKRVVQAIEGEALDISLHAIIGSLSHRTMRVMEKIKGQPIVMLVDTGSKHNFMKVRVVNGELVKSVGKLERAEFLL